MTADGRSRLWPPLLLWLYVAHVLIYTQMPFQYSWAELSHFAVSQLLPSRIGGTNGYLMIAVNVAMLAPLGVLLRSLLARDGSPRIGFLEATLLGMVLSGTVETLQVFNHSRSPSALDLLTNTLGCAIGYVAGRPLLRWLAHLRIGAWAFAAPILYVAVSVAALQVEATRAGLTNWNDGHFLILGNELRDDRPWMGTIYSLSIMDTGWSNEEARAAFEAGGDDAAAPARGLLTAFRFDHLDHGSIVSIAASPVPIRLRIEDPALVSITDTGGLRLAGPTRIVSDRPASELSSRLAGTGEFTIETWIRPDSLSQHGPARIVSLSRDEGDRNVTLAQDGSDLILRLRTAITDRNGMFPHLVAAGVLTGKRQHVVATYVSGVARLYVDGRLAATLVMATPTPWAMAQAGPLGMLSLTFIVIMIVAGVVWAASPSLQRRSLNGLAGRFRSRDRLDGRKGFG